MRSPLNRALIALILAASLFTGILAPALGQQGHNPFAPSPAPADDSWRIVNERAIDVEGQLVTLSPDGQWLAGIGPEGDQFCIWNVETLVEDCDNQFQPIHAESITWSPDSTAVAYSLDLLLRFYDSDIFVYDVKRGESVNLTDDGFQDGIPLGDEIDVDELPLDIFPTWTTDGEQLVFARTEWTVEQPTTELMTIAREGGEPESLYTVRDDYPWAIGSPMLALGDGSILYTAWVGDDQDSGNGIWLLDADGVARQVMPGAAGAQFPAATLTDVRETGSGVVASGYSRHLGADMPVVGPISFELDVTTGKVEPIGVEDGVSGYMSPFRYSPDGGSAVSLEVSDDERQVVITGANGEVLALGEFEGGRQINSRGLDWAANDSIWVPDFANGGTLITVSSGAESGTEAPVSIAESPWLLTDQRDLDLDGQAVSLSPDGQWIAGIGTARQFCVWNVETLDPTCEPEVSADIDTYSIRWAPDSTAVAYSLDALRSFYDSDVFVFEIDEGLATNVTEDGFKGPIPLQAKDAGVSTLPVDYLPAWSSDSQSLSFVRTEWFAEDLSTELMTISRSGDDLAHRFTVAGDHPWAIRFPMFALADGSLLYAVAIADGDAEGNGIWRLDASGTAEILMTGGESDAYPMPAITGVVETGANFIATGYSTALFNQDGVRNPLAFSLDLASGEVQAMEGADAHDQVTSPVRYSPDGVSTVGLTWEFDGVHLVIEDVAGKTDLGLFESAPYAFTRGVDWAANNSILMIPSDGSSSLITLSREDEPPPCSCEPPPGQG